MGKVIPFRKIKKNTLVQKESVTVAVGFDRIHAILNDDSLSPAERNWVLENMLMQIDEQLEQHKREVEKAERKLHDLVQAAEQEIASVSREHKGKKLSTLLQSWSFAGWRVPKPELGNEKTSLVPSAEGVRVVGKLS